MMRAHAHADVDVNTGTTDVAIVFVRLTGVGEHGQWHTPTKLASQSKS
jgi:hypothetical protein